MDHKKYLELALEQAHLAKERGDYPIGAVLVDEDGEVISTQGNMSFSTNDVSAHAEILCFKQAGKLASKSNPKKLILYSTLEPCYGCGFFTTYTNVKTIVWALTDTYKGGVEDLRSLKKIKASFEDIEFIEEPVEECKNESKKLMRQYHTDRGNTEKAKHYD